MLTCSTETKEIIVNANLAGEEQEIVDKESTEQAAMGDLPSRSINKNDGFRYWDSIPTESIVTVH